ncbi:MAG TPA: hypothetical protein H9695_15190, partial [Candidatus Mediterraneibacter excrementigallinarum]|nr:hypothetical protein [Candidatus Mediterraneibacter excrementigallinarum]
SAEAPIHLPTRTETGSATIATAPADIRVEPDSTAQTGIVTDPVSTVHTGTMQASGITARVQADITENITVDKHAAVIFFRTSRKQGEGQRHAERGRKMFSAAGPFPWTL